MAEPIPNQLLTKQGFLPIRKSPVRFAVGDPTGLTSNSWRVWTTNNHDLYVKCRDNFREVKVSLHASGRWRIGFIQEAIDSNPDLITLNQNRAYDVWDKPAESLPDTVIAFKLLFPSSELLITPAQRKRKIWNNTIFVEAAPAGKVTVITIFVSKGNVTLKHESEPSFTLASLKIDDVQTAHLVAHYEKEGNLPEMIESSISRAIALSTNIDIPETAYAYFFGNQPDGCRFVVGARIYRGCNSQPQADLLRYIQERAYFLWENQNGLKWWDADSNWFEALDIERKN